MLKSPAVSPRRFAQLSAGRGLPILAMLCMMWTPGGVYGQVVIETSGDGIRIRHPGPGTLVNLQIGSTEVARLNMGEDVWVNENADAQVQGRFSLDTWPDALQDVSDATETPHPIQMLVVGHLLPRQLGCTNLKADGMPRLLFANVAL